jgi:hypothetical protein
VAGKEWQRKASDTRSLVLDPTASPCYPIGRGQCASSRPELWEMAPHEAWRASIAQIASIYSPYRGANVQGGIRHSFKKRSSGVVEPLKPRRDNFFAGLACVVFGYYKQINVQVISR